jgi:hypothetical protein
VSFRAARQMTLSKIDSLEDPKHHPTKEKLRFVASGCRQGPPDHRVVSSGAVKIPALVVEIPIFSQGGSQS